jgi:hypothetical protein
MVRTRTDATRLLICEGDAEVAFATLLRDLYLPRGCGKSLTSRNRRGFGAAAAVKMAIEERRRGGFDKYGVLIDTDAGWGAAVQALARRNQLATIECVPCLEAVLLAVKEIKPHNLTADNKRLFREAFGDSAHRSGLLARNFTREEFDRARTRVATIDAVLRFLDL